MSAIGCPLTVSDQTHFSVNEKPVPALVYPFHFSVTAMLCISVQVGGRCLIFDVPGMYQDLNAQFSNLTPTAERRSGFRFAP